jgi:midasin
LQTISSKLLDIYKFLNSQSMDVKTKTLMKCDSRTLSLRDLLKLCVRLRLVDNCETQANINAIIQDIIDCFLAFISNKALRNSMSIEIGAFFNVNKDEVRFSNFLCCFFLGTQLLFGLLIFPTLFKINAFFNSQKAKFHNTSMEVVCGRVKLKKHLPDDDMYAECKHDDDTFVYTRVALNLLERIARCIECNESVLLCGETGVGKTTILQHLAKLLGKLGFLN